MGLLAFAIDYRWPLIFYGTIILLIVLLRRKLEWQGFGMGIYRTRVGLRLMEQWGARYRGIIIVLGYVGIGVGFVGMALILWSLAQGVWRFLTDITAPPVVTPVIPGFSVPGFGLEVPLITGWIALFALLIIHEFSHGVVSRAHRIPVKSSGLLVFGPIAGAFVEPDEKRVGREHETVQYALSAAGPFSNILTAGIAALIVAIAIAPLTAMVTVPDGVTVKTVVPGYPASFAGLPEGAVIASVDGAQVDDREALGAHMEGVAPGSSVTLGTDRGEYVLATVENPDDPASSYLGVTIEDHSGPRMAGLLGSALASVMLWIGLFFGWFILLSLGIGLANLLPIGPLDGGRMFRLAAEQVTGSRKRGDWWWRITSKVTLVVLAGLLLFPLVRWFAT